MKNLLQRDKNKRKLFLKEEKERLALKYLCSNRFLSLRIRWSLILKFEKFSCRVVQLKNRCVKTFRQRSILRSFRLSRILLRNYACSGKIFGLAKESW
mmetsp:Transcript_38079/g.122260  ORF Transcript_38079/g.122260 Transcript_38079/m.122260 type:complete len:98 (-) Transcript_38079:16-309(-)